MHSLKDIEGREVCGNCAHGEFEMTSHKPPRFKIEEGYTLAGACRFDIRPIFDAYIAKLPVAVTDGYSAPRSPTSSAVEFNDGAGCPCFAPRQD